MTSTDLHTHPGSAPEPHHRPHEHAHPSDRKYVVVAVFLAVVTALEVSTYFWEDASTTALVLTLFPMMIIKFAVVCAYFMHLRYDNPLFRRVFLFGLVLAIGVYTAALGAMNFFDA
jgi:cytochrome c oxidase subunit 4